MKKMSLQLSKVLGALMVAGLTMVSLGASGQSKGKTMPDGSVTNSPISDF